MAADDVRELIARLRLRTVQKFIHPAGTGSQGGYFENLPDEDCQAAAKELVRLTAVEQVRASEPTTHDMMIASEATEKAVLEIERWRGRSQVYEKALVEIEHHSNDKNAAATARSALAIVDGAGKEQVRASGGEQPIPPNVYFRYGNFYDARSCMEMGVKFYEKWKRRAWEFPGASAPSSSDQAQRTIVHD